MKITEKGKSVCGIVLPQNPTKRELHAAEEIICYIKKISGAEIEITDKYEYKIIIGEPDKNDYAKELMSQQEFEKLVPGPEGFIIYSDEKCLFLAGSSKNEHEMERGTVYAVYEFLERCLGCSLCAYSKDNVDAGEYLPEKSDIEIDRMQYVKACADISYRTAIVQYSAWAGNPNHKLNEKFITWLSKNRYNRILTWASIYEGYKENGMVEEAEKRGILFSVGHHESIKLFLPHEGNKYFSEKYYETHPEFYKLQSDGTRFFMRSEDYDGQLILCVRNEEMLDTLSDNIVKWIDENGQVDTICLWPNDGINEACQCEKCKKYSKMENYTYLVDRVARRVSKKRSYVKIDMLTYNDMYKCELDDVSSSVVVDQSTLLDSGLRSVGKPDGSCLIGTHFEDIVSEWKKSGAEVVFYDYFMGVYGSKQKWLPMADEMQAICKFFKEKGILGLGTQIEVYNMWNNIFNFFTFGRTAYDNELSLEDNLNKFCKIFGNASSIIKEIVLYGESVVDGNNEIMTAGEQLIKNVDKEKIYELYEEALKKAETNRARNNVRMMRMVFRYSDLEVNNPKFDVSVWAESNSIDETGEMWFMRENFDSFLSGREGYGIAIPVFKKNDVKFTPDYWYDFE